MFTIIKTVSGVWYHLFNNGATKVHLSDFDVIIDAIAETYVIEAKNGSNIPSQAISISDIRVIDDSVSTTIPIPFSGATGLIELLTSLGYPPYLSNAPAQPPVKVWSKGDAISINKTQTWIDANFDATGLGINEAVGWAKRNGQNGTRDAQDRSLLNQGTKFANVGILYGFENTVLVAHDHDSIEYSDGKKGVNTVGKGATVAGRAIAESSATDKTNKTSKDGKTYLGVPSNVETGVGKNYHPILVELFIERVSDLWIMGGSSTSLVPNLTQVLTVGDVPMRFETFPSFPANSFITLDLWSRLTDNYYDTLNAGTGGLFLDKTIIFPENTTIKWQAGYVEDNPVPAGSTLYPYRFTTDAYVFYQGAIVTDITLQPEDVCTLKLVANNSTDGIQIWFLSIVSRGSGGSVDLAETLAIDNKTNDIPIVSNNGKAVVFINDAYAEFGYDTQFIGMTDAGFQLYSDVPLQFDSNVSTDFNTPVLKYNGNEVATTDQLTGGTVTNVSGTTDEITVSNPTTTPAVGISSNYTTARDAYADAKVADNLTASTTVAPSKTAVNTALGLKIDKTSWIDYSAISTIVGWSSFTTKKISYKIIDNAMIVDFNLEGTSNATTASFTIPSNAAASSFVLSAYIINLGGVLLYPGRINSAAGSNVITIQRDSQNGPFTASGTKRCSGQIIIQL